MSEVVLSLRGVSRTFRTAARVVEVLKRVDLEARRGRLLAVAGPSGCGKTTLLHIAALLDAPDAGERIFDGIDVSGLGGADLARLRRERIGMVFQRFHLLPHRSALENVAFRFRYTTVPAREARERAREALDSVGLSAVAHTPARLLSGGEMQRVAVARALALPPLLLLADEPTGNLDADAARHVMDLLAGCRPRGIAVLVATHNPRWVAECDDIVRLDGPSPKQVPG
ncbi:MAG: ATP-binding cassette domain-containing protein [Lentisphaerae bacterium]|nr:ATP-binding cassette domain-containing protein [Lentisphaerota bacterium]